MVQVAGHGIEPLMSNFSVNSFPVKVVILAGLGVVAVGSFPPFAEEICNRFPILTYQGENLTEIVFSYNVTDQSPMAPSFTTGTFGISISNTDTSLACTDSNTASAKAMDVFKGDMLIVAGQVVMAVQGVYEEKVVTKYDCQISSFSNAGFGAV